MLVIIFSATRIIIILTCNVYIYIYIISFKNITITQVHVPFTGQIIIENSVAPIKSIELQLVRVETVAYAEGTAREATEIQNIQLADGDVCRDLVIPIYMVFPRLFTCPTVDTLHFKVEFEVNLVVLFADGYMVTENFPLNLYR